MTGPRESLSDHARVTLEVLGHTIVIEVVPSGSIPEKYHELRVSTERHPHGPGWTTDLLHAGVDE